jgi:hypothetical protein
MEGNETQGDVGFRLSIVDGNFRGLPLVATVTRQLSTRVGQYHTLFSIRSVLLYSICLSFLFSSS